MILPYHVRLAVRSLRRDPGLSATIVVVLALAAGIFCTAVMHYLRIYREDPALPPTLHQVEVVASHEALEAAFVSSNAAPNLVAARARVSFPDYRVLAASGLSTRQTATFRARLLVAAGDARLPPAPRNARFVNADFFGMFARAFRYGGPWTRDDEARAVPAVVLTRALNERLGGGDTVGSTLLVDDRPFRVVGVLAEDESFAPMWDRITTGGLQDLLFLPFAEHERLLARPEVPVTSSPEGPTYADFLRSDTVAVAFWIDLPTPALRDAYARYLAGTLGARGARYTLRDLARLRVDLAFPKTVLTFFVFLTFLILVGAGLVTTRLLLAKSFARRGELAIFRALGASRGALVRRQLLEATLLSLLGGALGMAVAGPGALAYNRFVADTDVPLSITAASFSITVAATLVVGVLCALYPAWRAGARRPTAALMRV